MPDDLRFLPSDPADTPCPAGRDPLGRFAPGNALAVSHGLFTHSLPPEFSHIPTEVARFAEAQLSDEADPVDEIPARRRALLDYRCRVHRLILQLDTALEVRGLTDKHGKLRVTWLQRLDSLIATAKGLDTLLGLARKAKPVNTLDEYIMRKYGQRDAAPPSAVQDGSGSTIAGAVDVQHGSEPAGGTDADAPGGDA